MQESSLPVANVVDSLKGMNFTVFTALSWPEGDREGVSRGEGRGTTTTTTTCTFECMLNGVLHTDVPNLCCEITGTGEEDVRIVIKDAETKHFTRVNLVHLKMSRRLVEIPQRHLRVSRASNQILVAEELHSLNRTCMTE